jgi:hypothetical protein
MPHYIDGALLCQFRSSWLLPGRFFKGDLCLVYRAHERWTALANLPTDVE